MSNYNVDSIKVLSDIEHMRKRAGMYIGECTHPGHLFSEIYDNALDELQNGYGNLVKVIVDTKLNKYTVIDNGRGIPIGMKTLSDGSKKSALELLLTKANSGGKFDNEAFKLRCLHESTLIDLADGRRLTIKEICDEVSRGKDLFIYAISSKGVIIEKIQDAQLTKKATQLCHVTLDNGEVIKCTPDHRFMLRDGSYKMAKDLSEGESLMPCYQEIFEGSFRKGYRRVYDPITNSYKFAHYLADEYNIRNNLYGDIDFSDKKVRHHKDCNKLNNNPNNIARLNWYEHRDLHINDHDRKKYFPSKEDMGKAINYNHSVSSVELVEYDTPQDMYDLEVNKNTPNFALSAGVFVHNCGLHGVGSTVVNALSSEMNVITRRDGLREEILCHLGEVVEHSTVNADSSEQGITGTQVSFIPDPTIFESAKIPKSFIVNRCKIASSLGLKTELIIDGELIDTSSDIFDLIPLDENISVYTKTSFRVEDKSTGEYMIVAMMYTSDTSWWYGGYTNLLHNPNGGTHYRIMDDAIYNALDSYKIEGVLSKDYYLGIKLVVAAFISDPAFSSQTKEKLTVDKKNLEKFTPMIEKEIKKWLDEDPDIRDGIFKRMQESRAAQNKMLAQKDISKLVIKNTNTSGKGIRRKSVVTKLIECTSTDRVDTELYICEGDSASGSFLPVRNRKTQAILPLRGKILNVSKLDDILSSLKNSEVLDIVNGIGAGLLDDSDPAMSRYERIIIACFTGDTKIKCLDGNSYSFKELVDNNVGELWVYSCKSDGTIVPAKAINPRITKKATQLCHVTLDNGEVIKCTPDHRFMLRDGSYKMAKDLSEGESLMPGYFSTNSKGYLKVWDNNLNKYLNVHTLVNSYINLSKKNSLDKKKARLSELHSLGVYDESRKSGVNRNHKVVSINLVDSIEDVYDITVPGYHNFLLDSGVFVHNCDSDEDGKHIAALVIGLMVNLLPNLVKAGMLYMVEPALYSWRDKDGLHFTNELSEIPQGASVTRFKGLGEMDPEEVDICLTNPATRRIKRINYPDDLAQMNSVLTSTSARRKLLEELEVIKFE